MRLSLVSPLPPQPSGIADYSATLLPFLRPYFDEITVVVEGYTPEIHSDVIDGVHSPKDRDWMLRSVPLYQMGNHIHYHDYVYETLVRFPGVTVLHDGQLLPLIHARTVGRGECYEYVRELAFEDGSVGAIRAWGALRRGVAVQANEYTLLSRVVRSSLGIIVHSDFMCRRVLNAYSEARVAVIPHLDVTPSDIREVSREDARALLELNQDAALIGTFGFIAPAKQFSVLLDAVAQVRRAIPNVRLLCVGQVIDGYNFVSEVASRGLEDIVTITGYVPLERFHYYLRAVDVGINLRYPTWGEMSGPLVRLLSAGVPTLVTDAGSFSEIPDEIVVKVAYGEGEVKAIVKVLCDLLQKPQWRQALGAAAQRYIGRYCRPVRIAEQYADFVIKAVRGV